MLGGALEKLEVVCWDRGLAGKVFRVGIRRPAGSVEMGRKEAFAPCMSCLLAESVDGRGPSFTLGLYSYAWLRSLVLGRADCVDILLSTVDILGRESELYFDTGLG